MLEEVKNGTADMSDFLAQLTDDDLVALSEDNLAQEWQIQVESEISLPMESPMQ